MLIGLGLIDMGHETYVASQERDLFEAWKSTIYVATASWAILEV